MKYRTKQMLGFIILSIAAWTIFRLTCRVDREKIIQKTKEVYHQSETAYRNNYDSLIVADALYGRNFLMGKAHTSALVNNTFPYFRNELDSLQTKQLIVLLNDSNTYRWLEMGTPVYPETIIYFDKKGFAIGYTGIEECGEFDSYPYRSLMKWGGTKPESYKALRNIIDADW